MPRRPQPWFRLYTEALHDPKLRRLKPEYRWLFVACLAMARQSPVPGVLLVDEGEPMDERDIADAAAMDIRSVRAGLNALQQAGLIVKGSKEDREEIAYRSPAFLNRQFESDDTTARTRKHRSSRDNANHETTLERSNPQRRNVPTSVVGTPPDTETDTDPPSPPLVTHEGPVDKSVGGGLIDRAINLAARRFGEHQMSSGQGRSVDGLAGWWHQENDQGARVRAANLLTDYDLTATQLADALLQPNPGWLHHHRRRTNGQDAAP